MSLEETLAAKTAELDALSRRFEEWKARAKEGVRQQRQQICELNGEVDSLKTRMEEQCRVISTWASSTAEDALGFESATMLAALEHSCVTMAREAPPPIQAAAGSTGSETMESLSTQLSSVTAQFDRYKKRSEQAMKLTVKENERLHEQVDGLQKKLESQHGAATDAQRSVQQREIAIAALERRLEETEEVLQDMSNELTESRKMFQQLLAENSPAPTPTTAQASGPFQPPAATAAASELQEELRCEFELELARQAEIHETERRELQNRIDELTFRLERQAADGHGQSGGFEEKTQERDHAYEALLNDHEALAGTHAQVQHQLEQTEKELRRSRQQISDLQARVAQSLQPAAGLSGDGYGLGAGAEQQIGSLKEQVWSLNQQLLEAKAAAERSASSQNEATQQEYTRQVFVKLMSTTSPEVRKSLLPVFAKLLQLSPRDLGEIRAGNPSFA